MNALRVLLVDVDGELRRDLRRVLDPTGATIVEAADGSRLLAALAEDGPFDLVIAAARLPPPAGLQSLSLARAVGIETPILVLTASGAEGVRARVAELGCAEQLDQPFENDELLRRVRRLVRLPAEPSANRVGPGEA